jgi:hypothetical protein
LAKAEIYRIEVSKGCHLAKAEMNTWQRPKYTKKRTYLDESTATVVSKRPSLGKGRNEYLAKAEIYQVKKTSAMKGCHLAKAEMNTWQRPKYTG